MTNTVNDQDILYVMAADAEYGAHLKQRISPFMCGVGPVEAAISLTSHLSDLKHRHMMPKFVVSLGSAGSRKLEQTGIYQASSVSYRDMDASALGFEKGATPFLDLPAEMVLPLQLAGVPKARLSTGANIVSGDDYDGIDADMVDMETFAIFRVCQKFDLPLIAIRGISDGQEDLKVLTDWTEYLHVIDQKLALIVDQIKPQLSLASIEQ